MQKTIWTNQSAERSIIQPVLVSAELEEFLKLTLDFNGKRDTISIFPGMEYIVTFYDATSDTKKTIRCLIENVFGDQIKVKKQNPPALCLTCANRFTCSKYNGTSNTAPMPTCNCVLNPPDVSGYEDPEVFFIPIQNIMNISYVITQPKPAKGGTKVMIVGITASIVKAIVVNLSFFDDNLEEAIKYVELHKDGIYDINYEDNKDHIIYEVRARVVDIVDLGEDPSGKCNRSVVREQVGMHDNVYTSCPSSEKDKFFEGRPVSRIKLVLDTSLDFCGKYETIMLDQVRNCTLVGDIPICVEPDTGDTDTNSGCNCNNCNHKCCPNYRKG